jgi:hypothetical protein
MRPSGRARREVRRSPCAAGQLKDVHAAVCASENVDIAAIIDLDVVRLNRNLAALVDAFANAAAIRVFRRRRDIAADLFDIEGIAISSARTPALKNVTNSTRP